MIVPLLLLVLAVLLSAFFSGSETGFYRATRVRLVLDARRGDSIARGLLWLTSRPALFVATALVGNNTASWLASLAIVMGVHHLFSEANHLAEVIAPIVMAPAVFLYGELLPKHLFYLAPNRLLRRCGPPLLICTVLFLPVSGILWGISRILTFLMGSSVRPVQLALARRELQRVLQEGHEAGILRPAQRALAQGLFAVASQPIRLFLIPPGRMAHAQRQMTRTQVLRLARRYGLPVVPVFEPRRPQRPLGYLRIVDLILRERDDLPPLRPAVVIADSQPYIRALMQLYRQGESLGCVVSPQGDLIGYVMPRQLFDRLDRSG